MTSIKKEDILKATKYSKEKKLFNQLNDTYNSLPSGDCNGCGNCCMESVGINLIEFLNILEYLRDKEEIRKKSLSKIIDYYFLEYLEKKPCPFKEKDNRCSIYPVRPLNCRLFGHWTKKDYNSNLENVTSKNKEYKELMKKTYKFDINEDVVNYKIKYCEDFTPSDRYLTKPERLSFSDELFVLDSKLYSNGIIDIEFKDRGIVEYFIEYLLDVDLAYKIKIKVSKDENTKKVAIKRLKKILL